MKTGIVDLPDFRKFRPDYNIPTDGSMVLVEISTSKEYRIYEYPALDDNLQFKEGPWKFEKALKSIEKEFKYKRPCQY